MSYEIGGNREFSDYRVYPHRTSYKAPVLPLRSQEPVREENVLVLMRRTLRLQIFSWILLAFSIGSLTYICFLIVRAAQLNEKNDELRGLNEKLIEKVKPPPVKQTLSLPGWYYSDITGYYYRMINDVNFDQAVERCEELDANLASIHSDEENRIVNDFFRMGRFVNTIADEGLIGAKRTNPDADGWMWVDGTPWDYTMWNRNEPNNAGRHESCVQVNADTWENAPPYAVTKWNDVSCDNKFRVALCKRNALH